MGGVVRVQALHALPGASDAAGGPRTVVTGRDGRVTLGRVRRVGPREVVRVDCTLGCSHAARDSSRLTASLAALPTSQ